MYDFALPHDSRRAVRDMAPSQLVVGIPSYHNNATLPHITAVVAQALQRHYASLHPVMVHVDGQGVDETQAVLEPVLLPAAVRRVVTRYTGLLGKGSALRAIFEAASLLGAAVVVVIEANVTSLTSEWLPLLIEPILQQQADYVLPIYSTVYPLMEVNDLLIAPLLNGWLNMPLRYPAAGEVALAGAVAHYLAERDVWETDVARAAINGWMSAKVLIGAGRMAQVHVPERWHHTTENANVAALTFMQMCGPFLRVALLHESLWHDNPPPPTQSLMLGQPHPLPTGSPWPDGWQNWQEGLRAIKPGDNQQWNDILAPTLQKAVLEMLRAPHPTFDPRLWARTVYDFTVVYNLGEGDPDKVLAALYPLYLLRRAALLDEASRTPNPAAAWDEAIYTQMALFQEEYDYFYQRWDHYLPPEQMALWRSLNEPP